MITYTANYGRFLLKIWLVINVFECQSVSFRAGAVGDFIFVSADARAATETAVENAGASGAAADQGHQVHPVA